MKFSAAVSSASDLDRALAETIETTHARLGGARPDIAFVFASVHNAGGFDQLAARVSSALGDVPVIGCSAAAVIGDGRELEDRPGLAVSAAVLPGVTLRPFHIAPDGTPDDGAPAAEWEALVGIAATDARGLVLLPDPFSFEPEPFLGTLDAVYPLAAKIGGLASGGRGPGEQALFVGDRTHRAGLAGLALAGPVAIDTVVAQGCRPIADPMFVTRCRGHLVLEINGRPVLEVLASVFERLDPRDQQLFRTSLHLGLAMRESQVDYGPGDFLVRNVLGVDDRTKALVVGALMQETQIVQFHVRDAETSRDDLHTSLHHYREAQGERLPAGALMFSCLGRGMGLFGLPDHDTDLFRRHLGAVPLGGFFCNGEIGPVGGFTFLHGYTSAFGLIRPTI